VALGEHTLEEIKKTYPKEAYLIEKHPNLLCDELKDIWEKIDTDIIVYHRLPMRLFETLRNPIRQKMLFETGMSKTLNSRHLPNKVGKSEAFDVVVHIDGRWSWEPRHFMYYNFFAQLVLMKFSKELEWGGNFTSFKDLPHFQWKANGK
jgi:hypothetical protein